MLLCVALVCRGRLLFFFLSHLSSLFLQQEIHYICSQLSSLDAHKHGCIIWAKSPPLPLTQIYCRCIEIFNKGKTVLNSVCVYSWYHQCMPSLSTMQMTFMSIPSLLDGDCLAKRLLVGSSFFSLDVLFFFFFIRHLLHSPTQRRGET